MKALAELMAFDRALRVGQEVLVRWGYGSGFRAAGRGRIAKVNRHSVQVELLAEVRYSPTTYWPKGWLLKGIPRCSMHNLAAKRWNADHTVLPVGWYDEKQQAATTKEVGHA